MFGHHKQSADPFAIPNEPDGALVAQLGVSNSGAGGAQSISPAPSVYEVWSPQWTVTETDNTSPLRSAEITKDCSGRLINYIAVGLSVRGNDVAISLGGYMDWVQCGSYYYPLSEIMVHQGASWRVYNLPARRTHKFCAVVYPSNWQAPYSDAARILVGYEPDASTIVASLGVYLSALGGHQ